MKEQILSYELTLPVSVNIAFRLTEVESIPGSIPSRLWLRVVETSQLKLKKLLKWVYSDKYG